MCGKLRKIKYYCMYSWKNSCKLSKTYEYSYSDFSFTPQPHGSSPAAKNDVGKFLGPLCFKQNQYFLMFSTNSNSEKNLYLPTL